MKLSLNKGMAKKLAEALGLDPKKIARDQLHEQVRARMEQHVPSIAAAMTSDGYTVSRRGEKDTVRDALFRLWRSILSFPGGGHVADIIRDSHDDAIVAELADQVNADTPQETVVTLAMNATLDLAF